MERKDSDITQEILENIALSRDFRADRESRWENDYKAYRNKLKSRPPGAQPSSTGAKRTQSRSNLTASHVFSTVENIVSNEYNLLFRTRPYVRFISSGPKDPEGMFTDSADMATRILGTYHELMDYNLQHIDVLRAKSVLGECATFIYPDYRQASRQRIDYVTAPDYEGAERQLYDESDEPVVKYSHETYREFIPKMQVISPDNCGFETGVRTPEEARWHYLVSYKTEAEIKALKENDGYRNIDEALKIGADQCRQNKDPVIQRFQSLGRGIKLAPYMKLITFWAQVDNPDRAGDEDPEKILWMYQLVGAGDDAILVRSVPNPNHDNHSGLFFYYNIKDFLIADGISDVTHIAGLAKAINTMLRLAIDNGIAAVIPKYKMLQGTIINPNQLNSSWARILELPSMDALEPIKPFPISYDPVALAGQFQHISDIVTGTMPMSRGYTDSSQDRTARGIQSLLDKGDVRRSIINAIHVKRISEETRHIWSLVLQYGENALKASQPDGTTAIYNKADVDGDFNISVVNASVEYRQSLELLRIGYELLARGIEQGTINTKPLDKAVLELIGVENWEEVLVEPQPAMATGGETGGEPLQEPQPEMPMMTGAEVI